METRVVRSEKENLYLEKNVVSDRNKVHLYCSCLTLTNVSKKRQKIFHKKSSKLNDVFNLNQLHFIFSC